MNTFKIRFPKDLTEELVLRQGLRVGPETARRPSVTFTCNKGLAVPASERNNRSMVAGSKPDPASQQSFRVVAILFFFARTKIR